MSKLDKFQKGVRKEMKRELANLGGVVVSCQITGVTVVVVPAVNARSRARYAQVAIALCGEGDRWNRKYGEYIALDRALFGGNTIAVPLTGNNFCDPLKRIAYDVLDLYENWLN